MPESLYWRVEERLLENYLRLWREYDARAMAIAPVSTYSPGAEIVSAPDTSLGCLESLRDLGRRVAKAHEAWDRWLFSPERRRFTAPRPAL